MLFSKAVRLFGLLASSGVATSATVGMIIFGGNNKSLIEEKSQVLENIELKADEFKNEDIFYSEDGTNDGTKRITKEEFEELKKRQSGEKNSKGDNSLIKEEGKYPQETISRNDEDQGASITFDSSFQKSDGGNPIIMPNFSAGKEEIKLELGQEEHLILGDSQVQKLSEQPAKEEATSDSPIADAPDKKCEPCEKSKESKGKPENLEEESETKLKGSPETEELPQESEHGDGAEASELQDDQELENDGEDREVQQGVEDGQDSAKESNHEQGQNGVLDQEVGESSLGKKEQIEKLLGLQDVISETLGELELKVI